MYKHVISVLFIIAAAVELTFRAGIDVLINGSGSLTYQGNPTHFNSEIKGSGKIKRSSI
jgi:hypothetical protein